jgi:ribosome-associated heat shock protein Hsp15
MNQDTDLRLDKWLWAARLYKTRSLAAEEIGRGRVTVDGQPAKPSRMVRIGDRLQLRQGPVSRELVVRGLARVRGPAPQARTLYEETAASLAARERAAEMRRLAPEPALAIGQGRPTKRDRRQLAALDGSAGRDRPTDRPGSERSAGPSRSSDLPRWHRWSASLDDLPDR